MEKGVYDALQKKHLKTLLFCILENVEGPMIEEYAFSFYYGNSKGDEVSMNVRCAGNKKNGATFKSNATDITPDRMRSSACKMVPTLVQLMRTLDHMPEEENRSAGGKGSESRSSADGGTSGSGSGAADETCASGAGETGFTAGPGSGSGSGMALVELRIAFNPKDLQPTGSRRYLFVPASRSCPLMKIFPNLQYELAEGQNLNDPVDLDIGIEAYPNYGNTEFDCTTTLVGEEVVYHVMIDPGNASLLSGENMRFLYAPVQDGSSLRILPNPLYIPGAGERLNPPIQPYGFVAFPDLNSPLLLPAPAPAPLNPVTLAADNNEYLDADPVHQPPVVDPLPVADHLHLDADPVLQLLVDPFNLDVEPFLPGNPIMQVVLEHCPEILPAEELPQDQSK